VSVHVMARLGTGRESPLGDAHALVLDLNRRDRLQRASGCRWLHERKPA